MNQAKKLYKQEQAKPNMVTSVSNQLPRPQTTNPYLVARMEWNSMFYDLNKAKKNWQMFALLLLLLSLLAVSGVIYLASASKFVPYIVRIDQLGNSQFGDWVKPSANITPIEIQAFIHRYIKEARMIIADPVAQKSALDFIYTTTQKSAQQILNEYYRENDPFELARTQTREIKMNAVLPKSDKTWQAHWTEITRDLDGHILSEAHFEGLLTIRQLKVKDINILKLNPLGLFVANFTWTQQQ